MWRAYQGASHMIDFMPEATSTCPYALARKLMIKGEENEK